MKSIILVGFVSLFVVACSRQVLDEPPLKYSFMPKYLDIDSVGPEVPSAAITLDSTLIDFKSIMIDSGTLVTPYDTLVTPGGILISDKKAVEALYYKAGYERQEVMLKYSKYLSQEYHKKALEAEKLYQQEIVDLKKKAKRSWFEQNRGYIGFLAGIVSSVLTQIAVIKVSD